MQCRYCNSEEDHIKGIFFTYEELQLIEEELKTYGEHNIDIFVANMVDEFGTSSAKCPYCYQIHNEYEEDEEPVLLLQK